MSVDLGQSPERFSIIDDLKLAISSKPVIAILALSTLCRLFFHFFALPSSPSVFGPDEGTYAALAKYASQGRPMEEFPLYGPGLYNSARTITLPSALLVLLGMDELSAIRAVSSFFGLASTLAMVLCFIAYLRLRGKTFDVLSQVSDRRFFPLLSIFTFFPSNFVWSTIGLRESGSQFWLITTFYLILKLLKSSRKDSWKLTAFCSLALTLAYGTRPETALVFSGVALLISIILLFKLRNFLPLIAISLGIFAGQAFTTTPKVLAETSLSAFQIVKNELNESAAPKPMESNQSAAPKPMESNQSAAPKPMETLEAKRNNFLSTKCTQDNQVIQYEGKKFLCKSSNSYQVVERNPAETLQNKILSTQILGYKRNVNALNAQTALPESDCQSLSRDAFLLIKCNISELPYRLFAFLFRPLIFFDQGSMTLFYAALENLGWMILIPLSFLAALRKREYSLDQFIQLSLAVYVILFASAAALVEGNLGTAFRHKSTILWPLIFILIIEPVILQKSRKNISSTS